MAKGFSSIADPNNLEEGFVNLADGEYVVRGVESIFSTDKNGYPVFVEQQGNQVGRIRFRLVNGESGPAYSGTKAELAALALAFGVDNRTLKGKEGSSFLAEFQKLTADTPKSLKVTCKNGWVNRTSALPPENLYTIGFVGAHRPDYSEGLEWLEGEYGANLMFDFEIQGDALGNPSLYSGYQFGVYVTNPFSAPQDGKPAFRLTDKQATPVAGARMLHFMKIFCPEMIEDYEWESDPLESAFGVNEAASPQYPIIHRAIKNRKTAVVKLGHRNTKSGTTVINLDLLDMITPDLTIDEPEPQPATLIELVEFIENKWGKDIFEQSGDDNEVSFTEKGKEWASNFLAAPWKTSGLPAKNRKLTALTADQLGKLLTEMRSLYGDTQDQPW